MLKIIMTKLEMSLSATIGKRYFYDGCFLKQVYGGCLFIVKKQYIQA
ncbi:hypothetical protein HMPREF1250_0021 [Megasphaera vaginalis (ex Srinivasan et al. 2021)]|uniref:Uncharacterized protein n=1 Tax=Megasphaera vaginalis (ex Srinivasan et al. 2021) TaxID=1111454 RepID=U7UJ98_9FIRM|nr:hypothetical protein HMPREF1250_0021 [Megasphaera vaginalis (ex Srinivasan et al. 2021)]